MSGGAIGTDTTHLGYLRLALEYFAAAVATHAMLAHGREHAGYPPAPSQNLTGQSIELCFKSYVLQRGGDDQSIRAIGHDLQKGEKAAVARGLLHNGDLSHLAILNVEYGGQPFRFRYLQTGMIALLSPKQLFSLNADVAQSTINSTPSGWRFLTQAAGRKLTDDGWLDLPAARGHPGRQSFIDASRDRAIETVNKQTESRRKPNTNLIEND